MDEGLKRKFFDVEMAFIVAKALLKTRFDPPAIPFAPQNETFPALFAYDGHFDAQKKAPPILNKISMRWNLLGSSVPIFVTY
ncbi:hypothetical protein RJP21_09280 [Paenibacillus sp. VCA1]|uniref:hypothetical protein n=1 Tax=Paenibacillus sp. VCA1 TaxID=3039148 RepID=UPI00287268FC|nr:hypothetical protein [Paenibacillus sp. VCA1]MDR9853792.1 hypothetical protein [Paenibacillus sp. VCA1]